MKAVILSSFLVLMRNMSPAFNACFENIVTDMSQLSPRIIPPMPTRDSHTDPQDPVLSAGFPLTWIIFAFAGVLSKTVLLAPCLTFF